MQTCVCVSNHVVNSCVYCTSCVCIHHQQLWSCVLYCTVLYRVQQYNIIFISSSEHVPSGSGVNEVAACPPSAVAEDPSALHLPPPVSNSCRFTQCQALYASGYTVPTILFKLLCYKTKSVSLFFCVCFLCIINICVKSITNLIQYSTLLLIVLIRYLG